jgi:PAS domain S-box-containing protein
MTQRNNDAGGPEAAGPRETLDERRSEDLYRALVRASPNAVTVTDLEGFITDVSEKSIELHGATSEEDLIGKNAFEFVAPEERERAAQNLEKTLEQGSLESTVYTLLRSDGTRFIGELSCSVVKDRSGLPRAFIATTRDISERAQAEVALRESEARYRALFNVAADPIFTVALNDDGSPGNFLEINAAGCEQLGYSREEMLSMTPVEIDDLENLAAKQRYMFEVTTRGQSSMETRIRTKDGDWLAVELNSHVITLGGRKMIMSVARDITERRRSEEENRRADKLESLGVLAGGIAHDFNNVLTGILGNLSLVDAKKPLDREALRRVERAREAARSAQNMTTQLLTFAKGGTPVKKTSSVSGLVKDAAELSLTGSNVGCEFRIDPDLSPVDVDAGQIEQVISNLVLNADQAMPQGGTIAVAARNVRVEDGQLQGLPAGNYVLISVRDSGGGILPEHRQKIFDPFFTTKPSGTGLGLATAHSIVRRHQGAMTVESEAGAGSTFQVYLPASESEPASDPPRTVSAPPGPKRVLVMDDNEMIRMILADMVEQVGYEPLLASKGEEALEIAREALHDGRPVDVAVLDLTVPGGMGGRETMEELRRIDPSLPGIVSSGYSNDTIMSEFVEHGFRGVLTKPYLIEDFCAALNAALEEIDGLSSAQPNAG